MIEIRRERTVPLVVTRLIAEARRGIPIALVSFALCVPAWCQAQAHLKGSWRPAFPMDAGNGDGAVHMTLTRGASDVSRVAWWEGTHPRYYVWNYDPATVSFPVQAPLVTSPVDKDIFCSAHTVLADGKLFVAGGDFGYEEGSDLSFKFDPTGPSNTLFGQGNLNYARWYPSITTLASGKALVTTGARYVYSVMIGGRTATGLQNDVHAVAMHWASAWSNDADHVVNNCTPPNLAPDAMEGHTTVFDPSGGNRLLVFGGRDETEAYDQVWELRLDDQNDAYDAVWTWCEMATAGDPLYSPPNDKPVPRSNHTAILHVPFHDPPTADRKMIIFGGKDEAGVALADCWMLDLTQNPPRWTRLADIPSAGRYNHIAAFDPGSQYSADERMLVFGGKKADGTVTDECWQLNLVGTPTWSALQSSGYPREAHCAIFDFGGIPYRRILAFGGRDAAGTLRNELLEYKAEGTPGWRVVTLLPGGGPPSPRAGQAAIYELLRDQMLVYGGETAPGVYSPEAWHLRTDKQVADEPTATVWYRDIASGGPSPRAGHTLTYAPVPVLARVQELYDPLANTWTPFPASAKKWEPMYPKMFALPTGKVFYAGPGYGASTNNFLFTPDPALPNPWSAPIAGTQVGNDGVAVMYQPGSIMKYGGFFANGATETITFPADGSLGSWTAATSSTIGRSNCNGTLLPTGEVLITGGKDDMTGATNRQIPQIWDPVTKTWGPTDLASEPVERGYHSTALLLPDGRVLSAGGFYPDPNRNKGTIYEPYYLFDSADNYATRPVITSAPALIEYGKTFGIGVDIPASTVTGVCLIRPSAVTHTSNFDQRYVPLTFANACGGLSVIGPANGYTAPTGDYMLFVLGASKVPSIAKWVRLADVTTDPVPPETISLYGSSLCYTRIHLEWSAPYNNAAVGGSPASGGAAAAYDLRWSTSQITATNFSCANSIPLGAPQSPGTLESLTVTVPYCSGFRYYAIKVRDAVNGWSALSNVAKLKPACPAHGFCDDGLIARSPDVPDRMELSISGANPARGSAQLRYGVPIARAGAEFEISVFDVAGRLVAVLERGRALPGLHDVSWDLRSTEGAAVGRGTYFVRFRIGGETVSRNLIALQ